MQLAALLRLFRTARYLKPGQILGRVVFRLRRPRLDHRPAPARRSRSGRWFEHAWRGPSLLGPETFVFLNETHSLASAADWNNPAWEKLWLYNLHYFDDLAARDSERRFEWQEALIERWIAENPAPHGNGWEPYPLSLRIVNWIKWSLAGNEMQVTWLDSLALQLRVLAQRLEWHLLGNHLLANAKALVFGGLYFQGPEAERWLAKGLGVLEDQLPEQVLGDGGHFERSPMYHAIVLDDLLDLANLAQTYNGGGGEVGTSLQSSYEGWCRRVPDMLDWLQTMSHPDGEIAFFNDAAFGIAPRVDALAYHAQQLGCTGDADDNTDHRTVPVKVLHPTGYGRLDWGPVVCLLDVAPVGPDYLPGHAHADTLSFELSAFGRRVVVNTGTSRYGIGPERQAERGTAAHSTVQIDGQDSSEVWGGFRVARRARPFDFQMREVEGAVEVSCAHDGYRRLPGRPVHRRRWRLSNGELEVADAIDGAFDEAVARFYLHPDIRVEGQGRGGRLILPGGEAIGWEVAKGSARVIETDWHPEFGMAVRGRCLQVAFKGPTIRVRFTWH